MTKAGFAALILAAAPLCGCGNDEAPLAGAQGPAEARLLEAHLERTPRDGRGWMLLARMRFAADQFGPAAQAYERALEASPKVAQDPQVWCELADALGMAQGGSLKGRPQELIDKALALKGTHPRALEMAGSAAFENRDYARALFYWETLLRQLEPGSAEHRELLAAVGRLRRVAELAPGRS
jgi:cytochrome c-type biogenesis protein CcmH